MESESSEDDLSEIVTNFSNIINEHFADAKVSAKAAQTKCNFCHKNESSGRFTICGHGYCTECFEKACRSFDYSFGMLTCPALNCGTPIFSKEIQSVIGKDCKALINKFVASWMRISGKDLHPYYFCPNCKEIIKISKSGYQKCFECSASICLQCNIVGDDSHKGVSCSEFKSIKSGAKERENFTKILFDKAEEFVKAEWPVNLPKWEKVTPNARILEKCKSYGLFLLGLDSVLKQAKLSFTVSNILAQGRFAWHGTNSVAIAPICDTGLDPKYRSGQVHGPGEYFGVNAAVSHGYCRSSRMMLVCFILDKGPWFKEVPGFCYVINNPIDSSLFYCLPVSVVSFGSPLELPKFVLVAPFPGTFPGKIGYETESETPKFLLDESKSSVESRIASSKSYASAFRWAWETDRTGYFEPYSDRHNQIIETGFEAFRRGGPSRVSLRDITRLIDDKHADYYVDFIAMQQINEKTSYVRSVQRNISKDLPSSAYWYYKDESSKWVPFESLTHAGIETAYKNYTSGTGSGICKCKFPGRPEEYELNFIEGIQTNLVSRKHREIKRE